MDDWYKMRMLLDIIHMAAAAGPGYAWIVTAANDELQKMQPPPSPATTIDAPVSDEEIPF